MMDVAQFILLERSYGNFKPQSNFFKFVTRLFSSSLIGVDREKTGCLETNDEIKSLPLGGLEGL